MEVSAEQHVPPDWFLTHSRAYWDWAVIRYRVNAALQKGPHVDTQGL